LRIDNLDPLEYKPDQPSDLPEGDGRGFALLSFAARRTITHIDIKWVDHEHKARIQKLWELLDGYVKLVAADTGEHTINTAALPINHTASICCIGR